MHAHPFCRLQPLPATAGCRPGPAHRCITRQAEEGSGTTGLVKQNEDLLNEIVEPDCLTDKVNDIEMGNTDE